MAAAVSGSVRRTHQSAPKCVLYVRHCRCQCLQLGPGFLALCKLGLASALSTRPTHLKFMKNMIEA